MSSSNYFTDLDFSTFATGNIDSYPDLNLPLGFEVADIPAIYNWDTTENPGPVVNQSARGFTLIDYSKCYNHPLIDLC